MTAATDPNGTIGHDLLDAWHAGGGDEFDHVLANCLAEFDPGIVIMQLVAINLAVLGTVEILHGNWPIHEHLALLRESFHLVTPELETT